MMQMPHWGVHTPQPGEPFGSRLTPSRSAWEGGCVSHICIVLRRGSSIHFFLRKKTTNVMSVNKF